MSRIAARYAEILGDLRAANAELEIAGADPGELAALTEVLGSLRRQVDAAVAPVAAEVSRQSRRELGKDSLAKKQGFRTPAEMIAVTTGASAGDAARLIQVGEATAARTNLVGDRLPSKHPHVERALKGGALGVPAASAIVRMLERVALRADTRAKDDMEAELVSRAPGLTGDQLAKLLMRAEALLDPDGVEPKEEERRDNRSLTISPERDGMTTIVAKLDAESAAPVVTVIQSMVTGMIRRNEEQKDEARKDTRSVRQMQADALTDLARHAAACDDVPTGPAARMVVRVSLDDLRSGEGTAVVDGIAQPVGIATARRMAGDAAIIPLVLAGDGEVLDMGRERRLFTRAQRLALVERDGGCAFCGSPPGYTVAHHIRWWSRGGPTDLDNGILLCTACHHRVHDDGWEIEIKGTGVAATPWFIPPAWLDPARTPRRGGRARYDLVA